MKGHTTVKREIERLLTEYGDALERLHSVTDFE
jgi:hypothetical protein